MQLSHSARAVFDEANLVSCAGLVPALSLAERAGWSEHLEALSVSSPNAAAKATCVVAGMLAGATGAGRMLAQAITTAKAAGAAGQLLCRADSAYYGRAFIAAAIRHGAWFSVTARANASINRAITSIEESAWTPIKYPHAVWDEDEQRWISDAEVAETPYVAFTSRRKAALRR
ncbi:hypothetical protein HX89_00840 [Dermacoccus nishinomiyaensis]|uniref:IS1380 family transposase n=1 Tax=Dermacoccus nishinomiyaensis TaxID=1274 RepID=A0A075JBY7_9MICO|nr:hypothetical protein HX89_00840 [Dermacoccus nishinomiyaensis]